MYVCVSVLVEPTQHQLTLPILSWVEPELQVFVRVFCVCACATCACVHVCCVHEHQIRTHKVPSLSIPGGYHDIADSKCEQFIDRVAFAC